MTGTFFFLRDRAGRTADKLNAGCGEDAERGGLLKERVGGGGLGGGKDEVGADCGPPGTGIELFLERDEGVGRMNVKYLNSLFGLW